MSISGVRGIVGQSLPPSVALEYGQAYGTYLCRQSPGDSRPRVCLGRDSRPSGAMLAGALAAGLMATGCDVTQIGIVTTPGTALMTRTLQAAGGAVITASHNPTEWNGIKLLRDDGIAYPADQINRIQQLYRDKQFDLQGAVSVGQLDQNAKAHALHIDTVLQICDRTLIRSRRFKVVLDSVNGAGCVVTGQLLGELGCEMVHLNERPTGLFAHTPEPTAENLAALGPQITKHKAAIGFAQDPDADRLAVIDEKGNYIGEEYTLALAAKYIFQKKTGSVAANLSTSRMIDDLARSAGCQVIRTPVGEAHVANAMLEHRCIIGGEGNGGVIDTRVVPVRDSLVGIVLILQLLAETGKTVSELVAEIPRYHMVKTKLPCPAGKAPQVLARVQAHYQQADRPAGESAVRIDTRDGIRIDLPAGWVHLRASNTEPILRLIAESGDPATTARLIDQVRGLLDV
ncbi:MAG: phosphoglucosamine mutase [Sedimentisphaerales bacterium]|nr:phosphoglucosamine mutase [Sedimentisphaerales bacterium]